MIRKVCWMDYKSNGKFMIKYLIVYLKIRLLNYVKVSYYVLLLLYERKNNASSYENSQVVI